MIGNEKEKSNIDVMKKERSTFSHQCILERERELKSDIETNIILKV